VVARIEHRRAAGGGRRRPSIGRLPLAATAFLALAVVTALIELWAVPTAWWMGVTEWWSAAPSLLPHAARSVALVAMPAAVAWGSLGRGARNRWLWRGAVVLATVQLLRYPVDLARDWSFDQLLSGDATDESLFTLVNLGLSLPLAVGSIGGIWALSEGVKDASGRSTGAVAFAAFAAVGFAVPLLVVPALASGMVLDLQAAVNVVSLGLSCAHAFVGALLAARAALGASRGARPARAWAAGAVGASVEFAIPVVAYATLLANQLLTAGGEPIVVPLFGIATLLGWPLFAVAVAAGMASRPNPGAARGDRFVTWSTPRFEAADRSLDRGA
jgi:hypothetical protein